MVNLVYSYDESGINHIVEERGNTFSAMRLVKWKEDTDFKLDIRKYRSTEEGEVASKGISFYNAQEASTEIIKGLLENGYGDDLEICKSIYSNRPDLCDTLIKLKNGEISMEEVELGNPDEYYDARDVLDMVV